MQRRNISQDLLIRLQKTHTVDDVGVVLGEIQRLFGFKCYFVLDMSRLAEEEPISFLFPSNISASLFQELDECLTDFATQFFMHSPGTLGPVGWDLGDMEAQGHIAPDAAALFRTSSMTMGASFPALGISGSPRLIGFSGNRPPLDINEVERLNVLMFHAHARLTSIGRSQIEKREPLSGLEQQVLFLAVEGESFEMIATRVALSSRTINYLVDSICRKMDVETIEHAVAVRLRRRLYL